MRCNGYDPYDKMSFNAKIRKEYSKQFMSKRIRIYDVEDYVLEGKISDVEFYENVMSLIVYLDE